MQVFMARRIATLSILGWLAWATAAIAETASEEPAVDAFKIESNLRAGVAKIDITPPADTKVVGHIRETHGARDPIRAALLILDDGRTKAAIATFDLIYAADELVREVRAVVSQATGTPDENILVASSHNHSGPGWTKDSSYSRGVIEKLGAATMAAAREMRPVSLGYGEGAIHFNINRRCVINGRAVVRLNEEGPCDRRVKILRVDDGRSLAPLAVVMHAVCHPCVFTWGDKWSPPYPNGFPKMSADFPGEAQRFVEMVYGAPTKTLFLQGCAGNIRPNLPGMPYRCGDEADIRWIGRDLGCEVVRTADRAAIREELAKRARVYPIKCASTRVELPGKEKPVGCEFQALRVGPFLFLTIPGEPFVEYAYQVEKAIADRAVPIVVGYANGGDYYVPTAEAFKEGGYEPNMTPLAPQAEPIIVQTLGMLADHVIGDVFESFAPTLPLGNKNYTPSIPIQKKETSSRPDTPR
jgi:neutral ceramidase